MAGQLEDMPTGIVIGLGSGLVSALLFYSAARGGVLRPILLFLTPLPSLVAGLGWGSLAAVAAPSQARSQWAQSSEPLRCRLPAGARLTRHPDPLPRLPEPSDPDPNPEAREWYPAGRLIAALAIYGGALPMMMLP